ncbi:GerAB/ArcD/ProY family transporter [Paenibacillus sp. SN-8-1]|uniref:GerAB/ArcD/ProY family transporter n=1 Tax=Paenibacillus sp. SN-8-1 TaxID=3435409 RepID=UPI003D9A1283
MQQISRYQMFALLVLFQLGTTIIFGFAAEAGRDAWLVSIICTCLGALVVLFYLLIYRMTGGLMLVEWFPYVFGKWLGTPLSWLYPLLFVYNAARIISDIRFLFPVTILHGTPDWVIAVTFLLVVLYGLFSGIEVVSRLAGFLPPVILVFLILEIILLWGSGSLDITNSVPIVGEGWGRVWDAVWPLGLMQTYGESIEFALFWAYVSKKDKLLGSTLGGTMLAGICITIMDFIAVAGMGEGVFQRMMYPAFALLKLSSLSNFLENLDALGVMYLMVTAFIKMSLHLFAATICIRQLAVVKKQGGVIVIVTLVAFLMSLSMVVSFTEHLQVAKNVLPSQLWVPLFVVLPGAAFVGVLIKKWRRGTAV